MVAAITAVLLLSAGAAAFAHGWDIEEAEKVESVSGKITFTVPGGFTLTTASGQKYKLMMHPIRFLDETGLELSAADRVSVSGYQVEETVILVTELKKGSRTFVMMDPEEFEKLSSRYQGRRGYFRQGNFGPGRGYAPMHHHGPGLVGGPGWDCEGPGW
jgi:hypothetical protein